MFNIFFFCEGVCFSVFPQENLYFRYIFIGKPKFPNIFNRKTSIFSYFLYVVIGKRLCSLCFMEIEGRWYGQDENVDDI